jgi:predicted TIM-barrel fold metal-dependent hydrolase
MPPPRAIDVVIFPFTPDTKAGAYTDTPVLRRSLEHLGIWDHEFTAEQLLADMDAAGVEKVLLCAQQGGSWEVSFEYTKSICAVAPDRILGTAGIDPTDISAEVRKLEHAVRELGFVGAHSYPHWFGLSPDDRRYYPFYWKCIELDVPVQIQVGQAFQAGLRSTGRPGAIDTIAVELPELKIVCIHTAYPWEREMNSVAWKHPNVYIGADCWHPRDWPQDLVEFIKGPGRDKVMWGTNKPVIEFADSLAGIEDLGLDDETKALLLRENVRRVYRL